MTAMNFPSSPTNGQTYTNPDTGVTYVYDSSDAKWLTAVTSNAFLPLSGGTLSGTLEVTEIAHPSSASNNIVLDSSGNVTLSNNLTVDTSTLFVDATNNRVGIGTTAPGAPLSVLATSSTYQGMELITPASDGSGEFIFGVHQSGTTSGRSIVFKRGGSDGTATESCRIDADGRLLVGTSSASLSDSVVQLTKTGAANGSTTNLLVLNNDNTNTGDNLSTGIAWMRTGNSSSIIYTRIDSIRKGTHDTDLAFSTNSGGTLAERMRITQEGRVYLTQVGTTFSTGNAANVNVDTGDGQLRRSTSSIKYKTDVETLDDSYADALLACRPVWYRSTCNGDNPEHSWWGFIAEEVATIDPRLVHWRTTETTYDEKGSAVVTPIDTPEPEGVQYDRFVPHLLNLIKRQKEQIESQGTAIAALEARLSALEAS